VKVLVLPDDTHHDALDLHLSGLHDERGHGGVRGLEPHTVAGLAIEFLYGGRVAADEGHDHLPILGSVLGAYHDVVPVPDLLVDHRITLDLEDVVVSPASYHVWGDGQRLGLGNGLDRDSCRDQAEERQLDCLGPDLRLHHLDRTALVVGLPYVSFPLQIRQVLVHRCERGVVEVVRDLLEAGSVPSLTDEPVDVVEDLFLPLRQGHPAASVGGCVFRPGPGTLAGTRTRTEIQDTRTLTEAQGSRAGAGVLERIVETKRREAAALRGQASSLRDACADAPPPRDLEAALRDEDSVSLIAEVKRRSPGAGSIRPELDLARLARAYQGAGAAAISVLTDGPWFGGSLADLAAVRDEVSIPVLRKDFTLVDEQVLEARAGGADGVLLIVRILDDTLLRGLRELAESLGMTALVEVHGRAELARAFGSGARVVGINNRDLADFRTTLDTTLELLPETSPHNVIVSESGIHTPADVKRLGSEGVHAVLVGEALLRHEDPGVPARAMVGQPRRERIRA